MSRTYNEIVEEAKSLLKRRELIRLSVAKLAIEACQIRHGGRSSGLYTLTEFSKDIGLPYKRLSEWVIVYKMVVSKIPDEIKTDEDWSKATKVYESVIKARTLINKEIGQKKSKTNRKKDLEMEKEEVLRRFKSITANSKALEYADDGLKRALFNLNKIEFCPKDDINFLLNINENVSHFIELALKIQNRSVYLMDRLK